MKMADGVYSVNISKREFDMLIAFKECVENKEDGRVSERELQEAYSAQYRRDYPFLDQIHINTVRDVLYELNKIGILRRWAAGEHEKEDKWELMASERGCQFSIQDD